MKRMISIAILSALILSCGQPAEWTTLFDGSSVDAWRGFRQKDFPSGGWKVENGLLKTIVGGDQIDIITRNTFKDFELELEWLASEGGNSGIFYNVSEEADEMWHVAPEMQVLDDENHPNGEIGKTSAGSLYDLIAPKDKQLNPSGEFNHVRLLVMHNHVEHWLNGIKILKYELKSDHLDSLIAESKFYDKPKFAKFDEGHIGLQHHGEEVWYRNIRIRIK